MAAISGVNHTAEDSDLRKNKTATAKAAFPYGLAALAAWWTDIGACCFPGRSRKPAVIPELFPFPDRSKSGAGMQLASFRCFAERPDRIGWRFPSRRYLSDSFWGETHMSEEDIQALYGNGKDGSQGITGNGAATDH
jgi:hypothetical protein